MVRRNNCAAESIRFRIKRIAGFVAMPLRLDFLKLKFFKINTLFPQYMKLFNIYPCSFSFCSLILFPKIILIWVSLAKWWSWFTTILDGFSSRGELKSLLGECGGVAYSGDKQSNRSASCILIFDAKLLKFVWWYSSTLGNTCACFLLFETYLEPPLADDDCTTCEFFELWWRECFWSCCVKEIGA